MTSCEAMGEQVACHDEEQQEQQQGGPCSVIQRCCEREESLAESRLLRWCEEGNGEVSRA